MRKERLQMISDGVIAIILTLMVLEIKVPYPFTMQSFAPVAEHIAIYALSFVVVAIMWLNHHHIFKGIETVSIRVIWLNFLLLFCMSIIPLPTKALGENFYQHSAHLFYGIVITVTAIFYSSLQMEVNKNAEHLTDTEKKKINRLNWISVSTYSLSIPFSFISVYLSTAIFVLIPIVYFIPSRILIAKQD
ncbi:MAG: DUF1211 domain-containing protein [Taibaiella sp.]|nr:DUF1211 domain-containing protein [Taibaiella sp.]